MSARHAELVGKIVAVLDGYTLDEVLLVLANVAGQVVAKVADNTPSAVIRETRKFSETMQRAAIQKMVYEDDQRRAKDAAPADRS